jgi:hypothetical protein
MGRDRDEGTEQEGDRFHIAGVMVVGRLVAELH